MATWRRERENLWVCVWVLNESCHGDGLSSLMVNVESNSLTNFISVCLLLIFHGKNKPLGSIDPCPACQHHQHHPESDSESAF